MTKAILLEKNTVLLSEWNNTESKRLQDRVTKYYTKSTISELSNQVNINNLELSFISSPVENLKKFPENTKKIDNIKKGDIFLLSDKNENMPPLLVMVWKVMKDTNTFYGFPVVDNLDLATKSSVIYENNTGLPSGWDFAVLFDFGEEYDFSIIDENGYFGMIESSFDLNNDKKGYSLLENFDYRENELISIQNLTKFYGSLVQQIEKNEIFPNSILKAGFENISELNIDNSRKEKR